MTDAQQARNDGFIVDTHCYPWVAYKGPRFNPTTWKYIRTDAECDATSISISAGTSVADDLMLDAIIAQEIASIDTSSSIDNGTSSDFSGGGGDFGGGGDSGSW